MKQVYVVGGGTAGWLTALYCNKYLKDVTITLIESKSIGILGAGEGTTPSFVNAIKELNIPLDRVFKEAGGNFKLGIDFVNWVPEGQYFHGLQDRADILNNPVQIYPTLVPLLYLQTLKEGYQVDNMVVQKHLSGEFKIPTKLGAGGDKPFDHTFAMHFDAHKLAFLLKDIGISRGIKHVEGDVKQVMFEGDNVTQLITDQTTYKPDFVFDCSGFKKLIISQQQKATWIKGADVVNTAVPFVQKYSEDYVYGEWDSTSLHKGDTPRPPFTQAVAMKHGWIWRIPTHDRIGCGYTFDSNLNSIEEIKEEILDNYPNAQILDKKFEFESGYYDNPLIGNTMAIGLSAGFIEPLEATSIMLQIYTLQHLLSNPGSLFNHDPYASRRVNKIWRENNNEIHDFVYLHYLTGRDDTDFWKKVNREDNVPHSLKALLEVYENSILPTDDFNGVFLIENWFMVMEGIGKLNVKKHLDFYKHLNIDFDRVKELFELQLDLKDQFINSCELNDIKTTQRFFGIVNSMGS